MHYRRTQLNMTLSFKQPFLTPTHLDLTFSEHFKMTKSPKLTSNILNFPGQHRTLAYSCMKAVFMYRIQMISAFASFEKSMITPLLDIKASRKPSTWSDANSSGLKCANSSLTTVPPATPVPEQNPQDIDLMVFSSNSPSLSTPGNPFHSTSSRNSLPQTPTSTLEPMMPS